eukprot:TRINITY_DN3457_c0_g2_i1.p1 TRINITY_DN3457_c0_g2~~TRINITY_DN3457_c0_g2_i1.p1  ORF type:complete len:505 (+),score=145.92 TRINITY_DN3457_c0_g2_i1:107-1621(+)
MRSGPPPSRGTVARRSAAAVLLLWAVTGASGLSEERLRELRERVGRRRAEREALRARLAALRGSRPQAATPGRVHVVFSSGCTAFQQWQAELVWYTHGLVGQSGGLTRIVSGCDEKAQPKNRRHLVQPGAGNDRVLDDEELARSSQASVKIHRTPPFEGAVDFPWFNKPLGLQHWLANAADLDPDDVVVVIDPDMLFLEPIRMGRARDELLHGYPEDEPVSDVVSSGHPVAQTYGIGAKWTAPEFGRDEICGAGSPCLGVTPREASQHYSVGPPYMATAKDMRAIVEHYARFMRPTFQRETGILADMYAYSLAAAHLGLPHVQLENLMVSTLAGAGEGWDWVDAWPSKMSCDNPSVPEGYRVPTFLHGCQNYKALDARGGEWMWHKGHIPPNILDCDTPLLKRPPDNLFNVQTEVVRRRGAFLVCYLHARLNGAALAVKHRHCPEGFNAEERVRLVQSKQLPCPEGRPSLCWPLAQLEDPLPSDYGRLDGAPDLAVINGPLSRN